MREAREVAASVESKPFVFHKKEIVTDTAATKEKQEPAVDTKRLQGILDEVSFSLFVCFSFLFFIFLLWKKRKIATTDLVVACRSWSSAGPLAVRRACHAIG